MLPITQALKKLGPVSTSLSGNITAGGYVGTFRARKYSTEKSSFVKVEVVKTITTIGINRPEKRNCVNLQTARELQQAFKDFEKDNESPIAVLYGKGGTFCAGLDLKEVSEFPKEFDFLSSGNYDPLNKDGAGPMGPSRALCFSKPIIAAIGGHAVAGGLEIALLCDLRVVEESATLGIFCRRFGVPLIDGGTIRLPRLIGLSRALDLILTGRPVKGKEALEYGLANQLVPSGTALARAISLALEIAKFPQECMNADRKSAYYAMYSAKDFEDAVQNEMNKGMDIIHKESVQGAAKFVQGVGRHGSFKLGQK